MFAVLAFLTLLTLFILALRSLLGRKGFAERAVRVIAGISVLSLIALGVTTAIHLVKDKNFSALFTELREREQKKDAFPLQDAQASDKRREMPSDASTLIPFMPMLETAPSSEQTSSSSEALATPPQALSEVASEAAEKSARLRYLGKTLAEAEQIAQAQQERIRVVEQDGQDLPVTLDFHPGRINLEVLSGIIIDLEIED